MRGASLATGGGLRKGLKKDFDLDLVIDGDDGPGGRSRHLKLFPGERGAGEDVQHAAIMSGLDLEGQRHLDAPYAQDTVDPTGESLTCEEALRQAPQRIHRNSGDR